MRILVTGGSGFIGSALIRRAIQLGNSVINVDCLTYAASTMTSIKLEKNSLYKFENINICDKKKIDDIFNNYQPDAIIHLAAESHVDRSIDGPKIFLETNIIGTYSLLEATREYLRVNKKRNDFRFIHVSTDEVYGSLGETGYFTETSPYAPSSPYSASKASSDHLVQAWFETFDIPAITTNCSNNYGPYQFPEKVIPLTILNGIKDEPIQIYGTGKNVRDWLYVQDHADALLQILDKGRVGQKYNIGGNNEITNKNLIQSICEKLDNKLPKIKSYKEQIVYVQDRPGHDMRYAINNQKVVSEIGWEPTISFEKGLDQTIEWYLNNSDWWQPLFNKQQEFSRPGILQ
jgi:dTDP-glucose 4,6-dehydratase